MGCNNKWLLNEAHQLPAEHTHQPIIYPNHVQIQCNVVIFTERCVCQSNIESGTPNDNMQATEIEGKKTHIMYDGEVIV